jgi:hypothetical protein
MEKATDFRARAQQCRRLAACILTRDDVTSASLTALAAEFDAAAAVVDERAAAATIDDYDDIVPGAAPPLTN